MTEQFIDDLVQSSLLHDIGKVRLPDSILFKSGKFSSEEYDIMKQHCLCGGQALEEAAGETEEDSFLALGRDIAYYHHERWDGTGYPSGLSGEEIPLAARVVAIADVYDALTMERRYKRAYTHEQASSLIVEKRGRQFDPDLVDAFVEMEHEFREIRQQSLAADHYVRLKGCQQEPS
jgi:response regulator RpfG family c-di-GMP phosphodiesterase